MGRNAVAEDVGAQASIHANRAEMTSASSRRGIDSPIWLTWIDGGKDENLLTGRFLCTNLSMNRHECRTMGQTPSGVTRPVGARYGGGNVTMETERLLTPGEVALMFRVDPKTVTRWASAGRIGSIRTPGGHRRFRESEVSALLADLTVPASQSTA